MAIITQATITVITSVCWLKATCCDLWFTFHIWCKWWLICQSCLQTGLFCVKQNSHCVLFAACISFCVVSYHNVTPEQILPYKEVHSPFISPQGRGCVTCLLWSVLNGRVYCWVWKLAGFTVYTKLCSFHDQAEICKNT